MNLALRAGRLRSRVGLFLAMGVLLSGCIDDSPTATPTVEADAPRDSASVYWVGHSLNDSADERIDGAQNLMDLLGTLAEASGRLYRSYDHTIWGASLRFNWSGNGRGESRDDTKPLAAREYLREHGGEWDTFVFTESTPIEESVRWNDSRHYLRTFYCEALRKNPDAEVFLYETWPNMQTPPSDAGGDWSFERQVARERRVWEGLADDALGASIPMPGRIGRLLARVGITGRHCAPSRPFQFIPAGSAMLALSRALDEAGDSAPRLPGGEPLRMTDLVMNPRLSGGSLRDPSAPHDDVHPTAAGTYLVALVAYAAIYRADPRGLPLLHGVGADVGELMQSIAWETVRDDPRCAIPARGASTDPGSR